WAIAGVGNGGAWCHAEGRIGGIMLLMLAADKLCGAGSSDVAGRGLWWGDEPGTIIRTLSRGSVGT
ncbi:hypothetical protein BC826DRAFT_1056295, partial [Russula brevipes]